MKRGWKIFWIVCACLAGLGIVLCISGFVMGATLKGMKQVFWQHAERWDYDDAVEYDEDEYYEEEHFGEAEENVDEPWEDIFSGSAQAVTDNFRASLTGIGELDVDVSYLLVDIQESTGDAIVFLTNNIPTEVEDELMLVQEGDELKVTIRNEKKWRRAMNSLAKPAALTIQIPKEHTLRAMSLSIGAGALKAEHIQVSELDVAVGAGQADIKQLMVADLEVEVGAGEADIAGTVTGEAKIECGIGKVNYQAAGSQQDYSYDLEVGAGVIFIGNEEYSGLMNSKKIMNGGPLMEIECGIGEVSVTFDK